VSRLLEHALGVLVTLLIGAALGVFILEYAAGCGETYIDANGNRHAHECVFINR
jgi:hypothetical protein